MLGGAPEATAPTRGGVRRRGDVAPVSPFAIPRAYVGGGVPKNDRRLFFLAVSFPPRLSSSFPTFFRPPRMPPLFPPSFETPVAPIAIVGGAVSVFSSASRLSNDNSASSALCLALLALSYAAMPRLARRYVHPRTSGRSIALAEEVVKMGLGAAGFVVSGCLSAASSPAAAPPPPPPPGAPSSSPSYSAAASAASRAPLSAQLRDWSPSSALVGAGLPSALYALQGTLTYAAYRNLDAVTFNGLAQLKVLSSALCCYLVLGKGQSATQVASLGLLTISTVIFQGSWRDWKVVARGGTMTTTTTTTTTMTTTTTAAVAGVDEQDRSFPLGVLQCLAATMLSGLAGALSQGSLQTPAAAGGGKAAAHHLHPRNAYLYTVEISFLSATCLVLSMGMEWSRDRRRASAAAAAARGGASSARTTATDGGDPNFGGVAGGGGGPRTIPASSATSTGFFRHWTYATLIPVATKAAAGLLTALIHRQLGSVIKGFALVLGLVFSALLQFALEGVDLTPGQLIGTALVLLSSWLHFTNPP